MTKLEEKKKYKLTLTETEFLCLEDVKGIVYCKELYIKKPPIFFNTKEEMMKYIQNLKCGKECNLTTKYECEVLSND